MHGEGAHCPCIVIADSRQGGQDNRLPKFVDDAMGGTGGIWVDFDKTLVEGILFQVSHYSVGVQISLAGKQAWFTIGRGFECGGSRKRRWVSRRAERPNWEKVGQPWERELWRCWQD